MHILLRMTNPGSVLLTASEAAERLGVDRSTIARWAQSGRIAEQVKYPGLRGPRLFDAAEVERVATERHTDAH